MAYEVSDIYEDIHKILGACSQVQIFKKISDAVEVLGNSGDFDPNIGFADLCVQGDVVTLPREVETLLAVNIGGKPTLGRDMMYRFHLNGLGDCKEPAVWQWEDKGLVPTFAELGAPSKLVAEVALESDENAELWAYGFDENGKWIRSLEAEVWKNGYRVPTIFGMSLPDAGAPTFSRVVRVRKALTNGSLTLKSFDASAVTGAVLGVFDWDETNPQYRRIKLTGATCASCDDDETSCGGWVRIMYRRSVYRVTATDDLIPLPSRYCLELMVRALKAYDEELLETAMGFESNARRLLNEAQDIKSPVVASPVQVNEGMSIGCLGSDGIVD
jgi:hypothetical protein